MTISLSQAFAQWQQANTEFGVDMADRVALAESWNDYTDSLCKDGELLELQYHYAPAYDESMPVSQFDDLADDREFIIDAMGVTISAQFVPFSQSRNKGDKLPSLNWKVTLKLRDKEVITTDYMQGSAHCPTYKKPVKLASGARDTHMTEKAIASECESGRRYNDKRTMIEPPSVVDVMYCLLSDARALDCRDFEYWCSDYGYDSDSIKAKAAYDYCVTEGLKLRSAFGADRFYQLQELFGDM
ncbi:hypothetical protein XccvBFoX4_gp75 [Xanthomonas phage FoX4]|uniref:Uncharacterized protein n=1 Tax=Xanthomonas phage FoX4 TaxID=2723900 RepID=A0A858WJB2_9CAUD|nr:hypothetical protein KNU97_gp75 [Xanthomonas phage FoX4]QJI53029.1 hypothetical protein XccvBFoX4_gp75 [Xanthomonas phage FoX4]